MDREKFIQASASTRVYEKNLLTKTQLERLMDQESLHQTLSSLSDTIYNESIQKMGRDEDYEYMLSKELKRVYDLMEKLSPDHYLIQYLKEQYIFHNIKVIVKEVILDEDLSHAYIDLGGLDTVELKKYLKDDNKKRISDNIYFNFAQKALDLYQKTKDPQIIDVSLDKDYFNRLLAIAKEDDWDFLEKFTKEKIDLINIKTLFRANRQEASKETLDQALIAGGNIALKEFDGILNEDLSKYKESFTSYAISKYIARAFERNNPKAAMLDLEKAIDDHQMDTIKKAKTITYGPEVIFAYIVAKETEIKNLRIILTSKLNSLSRDFIKERLRESYV
ncbi:MAG: V-type ATP synthase subunit C [Peptoniphilaceae bacterium]|nr:V-type ATP synthase subunit C [Peptoniphilaceae bacterium]MDY6018792.1 V-type ATP synthase subunit C [Anaerococcus sp.]